jgi:predicted dehydrogenase
MSVGLGLIGLGWWGGMLADKAMASGEASVVSCFARTDSAREAFADKHGCTAAGSVGEMLADPAVEGVMIATAHSSHLELIDAAASAGKPVFVEKPLTLTASEAREVVVIGERTGVPIQVGHQRRKSAANRGIKALIDDGSVGPIQMATSNQSVPGALSHAADAWRRDRSESPLGGMTSLGVHKIDTFHYLVGPMKRVFTMSKNTMPDPEIDEATVVSIEFENGAVGTLVTSFVVPVISTVSIFGLGFSAHNEADGSKLFIQRAADGPARTEVELDPVDPIAAQIVEFASVVRGETAPEVGAVEGAAVVAVMEAMIASDETGQPVDVEY